MDKETRKKWVFLQEQHLAVCFDQGEQPDEFCSPYSAGADALQRVAAIDAAKAKAIRDAELQRRADYKHEQEFFNQG